MARLAILAAFVTPVLFAPMAYADGVFEDLFEQLDANQDTHISSNEAELLPVVERFFDRLDLDRDGKLDAQEFAQLQGI
ncbi:hypothetical protein [Balneatrix alpica]|uniref:EF-hand domain-containing protein n=1 Tax=Balneatrix alpica TaxID=75684 RepID=A0ABV5ZCJ0_9GAMM|nr:hypothetical protein [Balneatrix alpica]